MTKKRLIFQTVTIALVVLISEALFFVAYFVRTGHAISLTALQRERSSLVGEPPELYDASQLVHKHLGGQTDVRPPEQVRAEVLHPYLGFVYTPERDNAEFRATYASGISPWGFVDDKDPIQPRAPNRLIVGIFGGSVAWYFSKEGADTLIRGLKAVPAFRDKEIVIVRTALFGYKQPQQLLALTYLLSMGAHFDIVINLDGFNEAVLPVTENLLKRVFPFYPRSWFLRIADSPTSRRFMDHVTALRERRRVFADAASTPIIRDSVTVNVAWKVVDRYVSNTINREQLDWLKQPLSDGTYAATGPFPVYKDEAQMYGDLADKWKTASLQMSRLAHANGIAYYHFLQPNQHVEGSKVMSPEERKVAIDEGFVFARPARTGYPYLIAAGKELEREGDWYRDLTRVYSDVAEPVYVDTCCHVNKLGNDRMASAIASTIVQTMKQ